MATGETHLDVEVVGTLCPDADIAIYRGSNSLDGFAAAISGAVADGYTVLSISWAFTEPAGIDQGPIEAALESAAGKGVTVCCSAGDGSSSNLRSGNQAVGAADNLAHVAYPASSPHALACGGTELVQTSGASGAKTTSEEVWNNASMGGGATGGGVSEVFQRPSWQESAAAGITSVNSGVRGRVLPDVAGLAAYSSGGDWKIYQNAGAEASGGTSAVAPLWASLVTLANEKRAAAGKKPLGYLNERLYGLAAKGGLFNDVVAGNNKPTSNDKGYDAGPGFDACTGWGTPIGAKLFAALVGLP